MAAVATATAPATNGLMNLMEAPRRRKRERESEASFFFLLIRLCWGGAHEGKRKCAAVVFPSKRKNKTDARQKGNEEEGRKERRGWPETR